MTITFQQTARRECDVWKTTRGGEHNYEMAKILVSSLEKALLDAIREQQMNRQ